MPTFPGVKNGDYIIMENEGRFQVTGGDPKAIISQISPTRIVEMTLLSPIDPIYNYDITDTLSSITEIKSNIEEGSVDITGLNLVPIFGETKLIIWDGDNNEYEVYKGEHLRYISPTRLAFRSSKMFPPSKFNYRLRLNGKVFKGLVN